MFIILALSPSRICQAACPPGFPISCFGFREKWGRSKTCRPWAAPSAPCTLFPSLRLLSQQSPLQNTQEALPWHASPKLPECISFSHWLCTASRPSTVPTLKVTYQDRITSNSRQNEVLKCRSHNLNLSWCFVLEDKEYIRCSYLHNLVVVEPKHLLVSFSQHHVRSL